MQAVILWSILILSICTNSNLGLDIVAIFYPSSQFCEIDVSLLSLQTQPNRAPDPFQRRVEYGKYGGNLPTSSATPATTPRRAWEVSAMSVCLDLFRLSSNMCDRSLFKSMIGFGLESDESEFTAASAPRQARAILLQDNY